MCLILFAYRVVPGQRLVLAANRDEFLDRPTEPMAWRSGENPVLSGRDLRGGGTWLGLDPKGRLGAITNYRDPSRVVVAAPSRGKIIPSYLRAGSAPSLFLASMLKDSAQYNGFNLLLYGQGKLFYASSVTGEMNELEPGYYGLSNHLLNTPWPKVRTGVQRLREVLERASAPAVDLLFTLLMDRRQPEDMLLPDTGVGLEWERVLSPLFINSRGYGTRSSTVVQIGADGVVTVEERSWSHDGVVRETGRERFTFLAA